jgi:hemolysin activation/secretion protein
VYPAVWNLASTFGELHGDVATYLTARLPLEPTLALRVGGKRVWSAYPFQEGAFLGGSTTLRGLYRDRLVGDASAYANAELRVHLTRVGILVPGELGLFGLTDVGRVWLAGESSSLWHKTFGGGLWFAYLNRRNTMTLALARGEGRTAFYLRSGFMF